MLVCFLNFRSLARSAFSSTLDWEKINSLSLNNLVNTLSGKHFLTHFILNPPGTTSTGHYTCNTNCEPLRGNRHQKITPSGMSLI